MTDATEPINTPDDVLDMADEDVETVRFQISLPVHTDEALHEAYPHGRTRQERILMAIDDGLWQRRKTLSDDEE